MTMLWKRFLNFGDFIDSGGSLTFGFLITKPSGVCVCVCVVTVLCLVYASVLHTRDMKFN